MGKLWKTFVLLAGLLYGSGLAQAQNASHADTTSGKSNAPSGGNKGGGKGRG